MARVTIKWCKESDTLQSLNYTLWDKQVGKVKWNVTQRGKTTYSKCPDTLNGQQFADIMV